MTELSFRAARPADVPGIVMLLAKSGLPDAGVDENIDGFLLAFQDESLAGCAGFEHYGTALLLRSVAVNQANRSLGIGRQLVTRLLNKARDECAHRVLLLTTTAAPFFETFGFYRISRAEVPAQVKESVQFQGACPASATVMQMDPWGEETGLGSRRKDSSGRGVVDRRNGLLFSRSDDLQRRREPEAPCRLVARSKRE